MADTAGYPDNAAKAGLSSHNVADAIQSNKRKRDTRDQGPNSSRPAPSDSARGSANFQASANNTAGGATDLSDQAAASFLAAHNASTNDEDMQQQFDLHQNGAANTSNAGDTAAAALAHYSMTVPQATEISFQTQASSGEGTSFSMGDHGVHQTHGMPESNHNLLNISSHTQRSGASASNESPPNTGGHKPPVGSEEWHKVRRDNHKEGKSTCCDVYTMQACDRADYVRSGASST